MFLISVIPIQCRAVLGRSFGKSLSKRDQGQLKGLKGIQKPTKNTEEAERYQKRSGINFFGRVQTAKWTRALASPPQRPARHCIFSFGFYILSARDLRFKIACIR